MKSLRIVAPRTIEFFETPIPKPKAGEVQVRLEMTCLCGSDSPLFNYDFEAVKGSGKRSKSHVVDYDKKSIYPLNDALSLHECVGTVTQSESPDYQNGDFVLALPFDQHGFCEYLTIPANRIFKLPKNAVSKKEILMCQPLGTVLFGLRKLPHIKGKTVAVIGQGPIGLLMNQAIKQRGANKVIGIDKMENRAQLGLKMGATHALCSAESEMNDAVIEINEGDLADISIECALSLIHISEPTRPY